jgi:hypothetical protein
LHRPWTCLHYKTGNIKINFISIVTLLGTVTENSENSKLNLDFFIETLFRTCQESNNEWGVYREESECKYGVLTEEVG